MFFLFHCFRDDRCGRKARAQPPSGDEPPPGRPGRRRRRGLASPLRGVRVAPLVRKTGTQRGRELVRGSAVDTADGLQAQGQEAQGGPQAVALELVNGRGHHQLGRPGPPRRRGALLQVKTRRII